VSVRRALLPTSSIAVATKTTISNVDPGDKDVPARTRQVISAEVYGEEAEQAQILFTTADHKYVDEPVKMRRESPGLSKFIGELNGENGKGLLQSLTYRIVAGDARSDDYTINVIQPPSARVDEVHYVFPHYTELPEKTTSGGDIDGWEGTIVTVKATANMKVARAAIVLTDSDEKGEKGEEISMQVTEGTTLSGTWKLEFRTDGTSPRFYHIRVRTENQKKDEIDSDPTQYALRIRADHGPDVALLDPTGDLNKPSNGIIPLAVQASDPDFKVRSVMLRGTRGSDSLFSQDVNSTKKTSTCRPRIFRRDTTSSSNGWA
jgi:collagen type III alpha